MNKTGLFKNYILAMLFFCLTGSLLTKNLQSAEKDADLFFDFVEAFPEGGTVSSKGKIKAFGSIYKKGSLKNSNLFVKTEQHTGFLMNPQEKTCIILDKTATESDLLNDGFKITFGYQMPTAEDLKKMVKIAFVGNKGVGKRTCLSLLLRMGPHAMADESEMMMKKGPISNEYNSLLITLPNPMIAYTILCVTRDYMASYTARDVLLQLRTLLMSF